MNRSEDKTKYFDLYSYLLDKAQIETNYTELLTRSKTNDYLSFIMNIRKSDIKAKKYKNSKFDFAKSNTPVEIIRILNEQYPPLKIEIMYMVHLVNNGDKNEFYLPDELKKTEKQALKNLVFIYGMSTRKFSYADEDKLSNKLKKYIKLNFFDTIKEFYKEFEEENNETMNFYNDYSSIREQTLSDKEILNAFIYFIDPNITETDLQKFGFGFKELMSEIKELTYCGFFEENKMFQEKNFYEQKAIDILYEFVECIDADTILSAHKREIRKEIDFVRNLIDNITTFDQKLDYEHLPLIDQVLIMSPLITLVKNYVKFLDSFAANEEDLSFIRKTGPVPKYHQYAFIQAFFHRLTQIDLNEKTKHKLIRILNILSNLTHLLGENFEEISSYDDENIDKILRKSL